MPGREVGDTKKASLVESIVRKVDLAWAQLAGAPSTRVAVKPANLVYGVEDKPPASVRWFSAIQQVAITSIYMIYPLILAREAGLQTEQIINILQLGCVALAIGVLLQALPRGPVGSRMLAPSCFTGLYLASSLVAVKVGGMSLVWGMTIFAGLMEMAFSLVWRRLRALVPPESAGLVVFFIGSIIALAACHMLLSEGAGGGVATPTEWLVAGTTLALMVGINIWSKSALKIYCVVIGMIFGFLVSIWGGLLTRGHLGPAHRAPARRHAEFAARLLGLRLVDGGAVRDHGPCGRHEHDRRADRLPEDDRRRMGAAGHDVHRARRAGRRHIERDRRRARHLWPHALECECRTGRSNGRGQPDHRLRDGQHSCRQ